MSEHFIKNIEIKNFKCFENFKAEGFGRVNLIGGKNNVGKTAFMEACFLSQSKDTEDLFGKLLEIETHRDVVNNLLENMNREKALQELIKNNINLSIYIEHIELRPIYQTNHDGEEIHVGDDELPCGLVQITKNIKEGTIDIYTKSSLCDFYQNEDYSPQQYSYSKLIDILNIHLEKTNYKFSYNFISPYSNSNKELEDVIGQSKLDNKYDRLNGHLLEVFGVSSIDIIKNKPMLKSNDGYKELSYFGQGIKTFINIISSILTLEDDVIFIDEIENGIHYSHFDKLWEIILTISEDQNVQVFATTHSKECIESYARVAKRLEDEEIAFIELGINKFKKLDSIVMDSERFQRYIKLGNEVRGW